MATVSLTTLRSKLKTYLDDDSLTNDDADTYINDAIAQWTTDVPVMSSNSYTAVSGQNAYDLPENCVSVSWVYGYFASSAKQEYVGTMNIKPGSWQSNQEPRRFIPGFPTETQFYLPREPRSGSTFTLYYGATHSPLSNASDTLNLRAHKWGELAVIYYACFLYYSPQSAKRARLEQWNRKQDLNVGNPLEEESQRWFGLYEALLARHSEPSVYEFVKMGRT